MLKLIGYSENELIEISKNPFKSPELISNHIKIILKTIKFILEELGPYEDILLDNNYQKTIFNDFYNLIDRKLIERR